MRRALMWLLVLSCLAGLRAQTGLQEALSISYGPQSPDLGFKLRYPGKDLYAVVVREDLPTVAINGARGRERGRAELPIEINDEGWKQAGSIGREPATGKLARGEIMSVKADFSGKRAELRLTSVEPHEIVRDADRPERNRHEPVVTVLKTGIVADTFTTFSNRLDGYIHVFSNLDEARTYAATLGQPQPDRRFTLGVLRRDGIIVPFASYDTGRWFRRWPTPTAEREVPMTIGAVPPDWWGIEGPATRWTMWTPDGQPREVRVEAPIAFDAHCMMNVGLRTDYRSMVPAPPLEQYHYPKDAVVTTGSARIEPVTIATSKDAIWKRVEGSVWPYVNQAELALQAVPFVPSVPVRLEVLCMAPGVAKGTTAIYFEAAKRYPPSEPGGCERPVVFSSGWLHEGADGKLLLESRTLRTTLSDCSQWNLEFRKPLGVVRVEGKPVWIVEVSWWGGERYELVEMGSLSSAIVLTARGGWCTRLGN